jgi:hypothetical protein
MLLLVDMVRSILTRNTRITDQAIWQGALETVLPKIKGILAEEPGFVSVEYAWNTDEPGRFTQVTTWQSDDDCKRYIRGGGAATVATIEEAAIPTAAYPNGRWVRENFASSGA